MTRYLAAGLVATVMLAGCAGSPQVPEQSTVRASNEVAAKAVDGLKDGDEHLLGDVLGLLGVAEHAVDQVVDPVLVGPDALDEGLLVALLQALDQQALADRTHNQPSVPKDAEAEDEHRLRARGQALAHREVKGVARREVA